jgi:hypothetical protein
MSHLFIFNGRVLAEYVGYFIPLASASRDRTTCAVCAGDASGSRRRPALGPTEHDRSANLSGAAAPYHRRLCRW